MMTATRDSAEVRWPNMFIVGAMKSGTTSLYEYVKQHPEIYMSPIKEPSYFCPDLPPDEITSLDTVQKHHGPEFSRMMERASQGYFSHVFVTEERLYLQLFEAVQNEKIVGEATALYLYSKVAPRMIHEHSPNAKIIMILRNPVRRAFSHYLTNLRLGIEKRSFNTIIKNQIEHPEENIFWRHDYLGFGQYEKQIKRYLDIFPRSSVKIYLFDDLVNEPNALLENLFTFLEVSSSAEIDHEQKFNVSKDVPRPIFIKTRKIIGTAWKMSRRLRIHKMVPRPISIRAKKAFRKFKYRDQTPVLDVESKHLLQEFYASEIKFLEHLLKRDLSSWLSG